LVEVVMRKSVVLKTSGNEWNGIPTPNKEEGYTKQFELSEHLPARTSTLDLPVSLQTFD